MVKYSAWDMTYFSLERSWRVKKNKINAHKMDKRQIKAHNMDALHEMTTIFMYLFII
jgi:hypothetical protein